MSSSPSRNMWSTCKKYSSTSGSTISNSSRQNVNCFSENFVSCFKQWIQSGSERNNCCDYPCKKETKNCWGRETVNWISELLSSLYSQFCVSCQALVCTLKQAKICKWIQAYYEEGPRKKWEWPAIICNTNYVDRKPSTVNEITHWISE